MQKSLETFFKKSVTSSGSKKRSLAAAGIATSTKTTPKKVAKPSESDSPKKQVVPDNAEEEKKLEKEEKGIVPFSWFLEEGENVEEKTVPTSVSAHSSGEPATKKLKSA